MYHRIYVPVIFRFFFPSTGIDFILETSIGNVQTHITQSGFFTKGMVNWFLANGPLESGDTLKFHSLDDNKSSYKFSLVRNAAKNN